MNTSIKTILDFQRMKKEQQKICMVTCYDYWSANIINHTNVDCILVGDTLAMVMHGHNTTVQATIELMLPHTQAVVRGAPNKFVIGDMPFCSYRQGLDHAVHSAQQLMQAGVHAIKLEGADGNLDIISHFVKSGIPVIGHLGLTPQSSFTLGGFKVQGKTEQAIKQLELHAQHLQEAGCFALVLECVPSAVAKKIDEQLEIATIGIGAGPHTSGQVLVLQDMLGMNDNFKPKFLKTYFDGFTTLQNAINQYSQDVKQSTYPNEEKHCYSSQLEK